MKLRGSIPPILGQLIRFGLVGALSTVVYAIVYWPLATYVIHPVLAVLAAFAVAVSVGYVLHSRWSFKGHGKPEESVQTQGKFVLVQSGGLVLNMLFTWVLTGPMQGPTWWPLVPAVLVTPLLGFALNRKWVFG
jgi:putative flippase GtrA